MTALARESTVPAFPLGIPSDGRPRYGMTPGQAALHRWIVAHKPHTRPFAMSFRFVAQRMAATHGNIHARVTALVERGWLDRDDAGYRFVHPIMHYAEPR